MDKKCPKCKEVLYRLKNYYSASGAVQEIDTNYYQCPKCKKKFHEDEFKKGGQYGINTI